MISVAGVYAVVKNMLVMDAMDSLGINFIILAFYPVTIKSLLRLFIMDKINVNTF